ncbi:flagellar hook protein FlgE [Bacillus solimangrovi]|uniref:Flagellar hook protein FlgE n=1 Tax=Bacillus solimangrovi TaxID=1305675 RepID=A0A1E5LAY7_9BACI|nr:flagellar hook protein FlgE [Bacillus solimangrovi]OEH91267.1 flagellar hook protein [Bacillus solimangrovi]
MLRSMYSGIGGLRNFQTKLDVIGNNVANVNTYGYKKGRTTFSDMMSQNIAGASAATDNRGGTNAMQVGLGSSIASIDNIQTQGSLQTTGRSLDLAISGDGYFAVKNGNQQYYTRAGNFYLDNNGTLVTAEGMKVQGYNVEDDGTISNSISDIIVDSNAIMPAKTTEQIKIIGNLPANAVPGTTISQQTKIHDDNGNEHTIDIYFRSDGSDWEMYLNVHPDDPSNPTGIGIGFDQQTGISDETDYSWTSGDIELDGDTNTTEFSNGINIKFDHGDLTNTGSAANVGAQADGNGQGSLDSFEIGQKGEVNGVFSNGQVVTLANLAIATFSNNGGLSKAGNNLFQESINSGPANIGTPGDGRGSIAGGSLEMSNVDMSEEFTEMIVAQRGFQANTRIITTSDEILQELVNLKR